MNLKPYLTAAIVCLLCLAVKPQRPPDYNININSPKSQGYYFFAAVKPFQKPIPYSPVHFILDSSGTLVYFKTFQIRRRPSDFKLQPNGLMSFFNLGRFMLMDSTFSIVDSVGVKSLSETWILEDEHELQLMPNGHFVLLGLEEVQMDLSAYPYFNKRNSRGSPTATVLCGVIQEQDKNRNVVFEWHSKDYLDFDEVDPYFLSDSAKVDWTHFNAVACDHDGNFLVSIRYFNQVIKIKRSDSTIMWRLGGRKNQFSFIGDPEGFIGQHDIRRLANGHITLFDNGRAGGVFHPATAKEYALDEEKREARLVWKYTNDSTACSLFSGSCQKLPNGNLVINYGVSSKPSTMFNVIEPSGSKIFEVALKDSASSYRAFNYKLPWQPGRPVIIHYRKNGKLYLHAGTASPAYLWSTGEASRDIAISQAGAYAVYVPVNSGGYIASPPVTVELKKGRYRIKKTKKNNN